MTSIYSFRIQWSDRHKNHADYNFGRSINQSINKQIVIQLLLMITIIIIMMMMIIKKYIDNMTKQSSGIFWENKGVKGPINVC